MIRRVEGGSGDSGLHTGGTAAESVWVLGDARTKVDTDTRL